VKMGYNLNLEQTQKLIMTPQLRQAITVLQLGALELSQYIQEEILNNPVLEITEEPTMDNGEDQKAEEPEWLDYFLDSSDTGYISPSRENPPSFETFTSKPPTLQDHLLLQLRLSVSRREDMIIGEYLIGNIDDYGYLRSDVDEAAQSLGVNVDKVTEVLRVIQGFDPAGVGARNLRECLMLQVGNISQVGDLAKRIIEDHLEDLAMGRCHRLAEILGVTPREVQAAADLIRTLDPKPGRVFGGHQGIRYIIPDVSVFRVGDDYVVVMNDSLMPRLAISPLYRSLLSEARGDDDTRRFIEHRLSSALWFLKSIEQRRMTLYRVVDSIIHLQRDFFDRGVRYLKPMTLKEIAALVGVHESTVSRAISNKYVQTPHGVFELRFFFSSGVDSIGGGVSAESVKKFIADIVQCEDQHNPVSDQAIADILGQRGISISRRTVAKYRGELMIPSSGKRKRY